MKTIGIIVVLLLAVVGVAQAYFAYFGVETQPYQQLHKEGRFEVRAYPEAMIARVQVPSAEYESAGRSGFRQLAGYIFGDNENQAKIAMTAPVHMQMGDSSSSMAFVMPSKWKADSLPRPSNQRVKIDTLPADTVAIWRFGGYANDQRLKKYTEKLRKKLEEEGIEPIGEFRFLGYNAPYQFIGRRNEIAVSINWKN